MTQRRHQRAAFAINKWALGTQCSCTGDMNWQCKSGVNVKVIRWVEKNTLKKATALTQRQCYMARGFQ